MTSEGIAYLLASIAFAVGVVGVIAFPFICLWGMATGLRSIGSLLGIEQDRGTVFYCYCGHRLAHHHQWPGHNDGVPWPCRKCSCASYQSTSYVGFPPRWQ